MFLIFNSQNMITSKCMFYFLIIKYSELFTTRKTTTCHIICGICHVIRETVGINQPQMVLLLNITIIHDKKDSYESRTNRVYLVVGGNLDITIYR